MAQAETMAKLGPRRPKCIEIWPEAILLIIMGIMKGETFFGPRSLRMVCCSSRVLRPPIPEPTRTPARSRSIEACSRPASLQASPAAAIARWVYRSVRRTSLGFLKAVAGSKLRTSPAMRQSYPVVSKAVTGAMPLSPRIRRSQVLGKSFASGVSVPKPVTTTRRVLMKDEG